MTNAALAMLPDVPAAVARSASTASSLRATVVAVLIASGANGDFWPALVGAPAAALGVVVAARLHARAVDGVGSSRLVAFLALLGAVTLVLLEAVAVAEIASPWLAGSAGLLAAAIVVVAALPAALSGRSTLVHANQLLFGVACLGVATATAALLYGHLSVLTSPPPHAALAIVAVGVLGVLVLWLRRSRYIGGLGRAGKIVNVCISIAFALVVALVAMECSGPGPAEALRRATSALASPATLSPIGLVALTLFAALQPIAGLPRNRQRRATLSGAASVAQGFELACAWLWMSMLGALVALATHGDRLADTVRSVTGRLIATDNPAADVALAALVTATLAIGVASIGSITASAAERFGHEGSDRTSRRAAIALVLGVAAVAFALHAFVVHEPSVPRLLAWLVAASSPHLVLALVVLRAHARAGTRRTDVDV